MTHKKNAYSFVELMLTLTFFLLLMIAMLPVVTKRHLLAPVSTHHGMYSCFADKDGKYHQIYVKGSRVLKDDDGDEYDGEKVYSECTFTPPNNAKYFLIQAIGAGGAGAPITATDIPKFRTLFSKHSYGLGDSNFYSDITEDEFKDLTANANIKDVYIEATSGDGENMTYPESNHHGLYPVEWMCTFQEARKYSGSKKDDACTKIYQDNKYPTGMRNYRLTQSADKIYPSHCNEYGVVNLCDMTNSDNQPLYDYGLDDTISLGDKIKKARAFYSNRDSYWISKEDSVSDKFYCDMSYHGFVTPSFNGRGLVDNRLTYLNKVDNPYPGVFKELAGNGTTCRKKIPFEYGLKVTQNNSLKRVPSQYIKDEYVKQSGNAGACTASYSDEYSCFRKSDGTSYKYTWSVNGGTSHSLLILGGVGSPIPNNYAALSDKYKEKCFDNNGIRDYQYRCISSSSADGGYSLINSICRAPLTLTLYVKQQDGQCIEDGKVKNSLKDTNIWGSISVDEVKKVAGSVSQSLYLTAGYPGRAGNTVEHIYMSFPENLKMYPGKPATCTGTSCAAKGGNTFYTYTDRTGETKTVTAVGGDSISNTKSNPYPIETFTKEKVYQGVQAVASIASGDTVKFSNITVFMLSKFIKNEIMEIVSNFGRAGNGQYQQMYCPASIKYSVNALAKNDTIVGLLYKDSDGNTVKDRPDKNINDKCTWIDENGNKHQSSFQAVNNVYDDKDIFKPSASNPSPLPYDNSYWDNDASTIVKTGNDGGSGAIIITW